MPAGVGGLPSGGSTYESTSDSEIESMTSSTTTSSAAFLPGNLFADSAELVYAGCSAQVPRFTRALFCLTLFIICCLSSEKPNYVGEPYYATSAPLLFFFVGVRSLNKSYSSLKLGEFCCAVFCARNAGTARFYDASRSLSCMKAGSFLFVVFCKLSIIAFWARLLCSASSRSSCLRFFGFDLLLLPLKLTPGSS